MTSGPIHFPLQLRDQSLRCACRQCARNTFAVAAAYLLIVSAIMLASVLRNHSDDLLTAPRLEQLKTQLGADSANEQLKGLIRIEDEGARHRWFQRRAFLVHGGWLLLGGAIVLAASAKFSARLGATVYLPTGPAPVDPGLLPALKISLAVGAALTMALLLAMRLPAFHGVSFSRATAEQSATEAGRKGEGETGGQGDKQTQGQPRPVASSTAPPAAQAEKNWLNFRGPGNLGVTDGQYPLQWDASTGKNIAWHSPVPLSGHSSPIVCGDRVFLTGGSEQRREVYCFDVMSGSLRWASKIGRDGPGQANPSKDTGWAPSTPASDGVRLFAIFPTGDLVCLDLDGQTIWSKSFDFQQNRYGHASSLITYGGMVFVQLDLGSARDNLSSLLALDCATGKQIWKANPPVGSSWSTPSIIPAAPGPQLITLADPWIISYEPRSGAELWRAQGLSGEVVTSSAFADGILYVATDQGGLMAIRPEGHGDVTKTHVKQTDPDALPDVVSPVALGGRVLLVTTSGTLCWFDPAAGKSIWTQDIKAGFQSSPMAVGGHHIYLIDRQGATHVIDEADAFESLAISPIGQPVRATPAFSDGRIFIRGERELFCIVAEANK